MPRLDDIEREAVEAAAGPWSRDVDRLKRAVLALWSARGGVLTGPEVEALLKRLRLPGAVDLAEHVVRAAAVGDARIEGKTAVHVSTAAAAAGATVASKPAEALGVAMQRARILGRVEDLGSVLTVLAPLNRSVADMTAAAEFAVHRSANEAVVSAARQAGSKIVFVPERDACLDCIERSGETGESVASDPPPVHPHCRCEVQGYDDEDVPLALRREAVRSVLRGFSLPSESEAERLRAAAAALRAGAKAPESVKAYARRAVREGRFPRGRRPGGDR